MKKRSLIVFALTLVLVTSAVPVRHVHGILMTPDEVATLDAASRDDDGQSKGDNTFVRVLKAPIKVIGRLFGVGKKDEKTGWLFPVKGALDVNDIAVAIGERLLRYHNNDDLHGRVECSNDLLRLAVTLQSRASGCDREHGDRRPA